MFWTFWKPGKVQKGQKHCWPDWFLKWLCSTLVEFSIIFLLQKNLPDRLNKICTQMMWEHQNIETKVQKPDSFHFAFVTKWSNISQLSPLQSKNHFSIGHRQKYPEENFSNFCNFVYFQEQESFFIWATTKQFLKYRKENLSDLIDFMFEETQCLTEVFMNKVIYLRIFIILSMLNAWNHLQNEMKIRFVADIFQYSKVVFKIRNPMKECFVKIQLMILNTFGNKSWNSDLK